MAYPATPLPIELAFMLGVNWVDVPMGDGAVGGVRERDRVAISYGRGNWAGELDPARLGFTLDNRDGRWSPDLTTGLNYPLYRRNIPTRMGVKLGTPYLARRGSGAEIASTPDTAVLDITGDMDVRMDVRLEVDLVDTFADGGRPMRLAHKEGGADGWALEAFNFLGYPHLNLQWFDAAGTQHNVSTSAAGTHLPFSFQYDRTAVRATLDVDSGGGTAGVDFWTVYDIDNSADSPLRALSALGFITSGPVTRAALDGILTDWCNAHAGTIRTVANTTDWTNACAAAVPGDLIRITATITSPLTIRGNRYSVPGANLTTSPAGGTTSLPIIVTCADGVYIDPNNQANNTGALDVMFASHIWTIGVNLKRSQFGLRMLSLAGTVGHPCYSAWNDIRDMGHSGLIMLGGYDTIVNQGGSAPAGAENAWGTTEYICAEANTVDNCGVIASQFGECVYLGNGSNEWLARAHHIWLRYNTLVHCRSDYVDIKPGCHQVYVIGNLMKQGAFNAGAGIQILYGPVTARPTWYDFDPQIFILFNRIYDGNLTNPVGGSSNYVAQASLTGVRMAFNLCWGFSSGGIGLRLRSESNTTTNARSSQNEKWWVFNNTFWLSQGVSNAGYGVPLIGPFDSSWIDARNNLGHTSTTDVQFTGTSADFAAPGLIPAVGATATADNGAGEGSAFEMAAGSSLVGDGSGVHDIDVYINDLDISRRAVPASATNPGAFQVAPTSSHTVTFYTAPTNAGPWTQLGSPVVVSGTTSIKANSAPLRVAGNPGDANHTPVIGRVHAFELRSGIGGTVVANPNFEAQAVGAVAFTDGAGRPWTIDPDGRITDVRWRFHGELSELPIRWDLSLADRYAPLEASGLFRRLRQGDRPLESALRRATTRTAASVVQYWPMEEDGIGLTQFGAAIGTAPFLVYLGGNPKLGANGDFPSSSPLPQVGDTAWATWVDSYTPTGQWQVRWLMSVPASLTAADNPIFRVQTDSGLAFEIRYRDAGGGDVLMNIIANGTLAYSTGWVSFQAADKPMRWHLECTTSGANISFQLLAQEVDGEAAGIAGTNVVAATPGAVNHIIVNQDRTMGDTAIGHVLLQSTVTPTTELVDGLTAYKGELAARRVQRLCLEEGVAYRIQGDPFDTEPMGPQRAIPLPDLLQECATTDGGVLAEARETLAVMLRTRASMQNQTGLSLSYLGGQVSGTPELDRDDQGFANDVTVKTVAGGTGRAVLDDGSPLSVSEPPVGAGRYGVSFETNGIEARAHDLAGWRLHLAAVDEPRVSKLSLETNLAPIVASPTLTQAILDMELGDLLVVTNPPANTLTGNLRQIVQGVRETVGLFSHRLDLLTTAGSPWDVRLTDVDARYDTAGSEVAAFASAGATSLSVTTTLGPVWTTAVADFPFDILADGVRLTVTAISGAGPTQTFTVSPLPRALNPAISATPLEVKLADPTFYEL